MKTSSTELVALLEVAKLASEAARVASEAKTLIAGEHLVDLREQMLAKSEQISASRAALEELERELKRQEGDLELVLQRIEKDQAALISTSSPKDAVGISHELETLAARQSALEDQELELMQTIENAKTELAGLQLERQQLEVAVETEAAQTEQKISQLRAEHQSLIDQVKRLRGQVSAELLEVFDTRAKRGVPIGRLVKTVCGACQMGLTATAVSQLNSSASDEVKFCPECAAILVIA
jgi:predicted  nucleic acid-binding Zn-ribbon protein